MKPVLIGAAIVGLILLAVHFHPRAYSVAIRQYTVEVPDLPAAFDGFTVLHFTDLHSKQFGEEQRDLIRLISQYEYDIIAITGDVVDRRNPTLAPAMELVHGLDDAEIYFVAGNHDHATGYRQLRDALTGLGVDILDNRAVRVNREDEHIWLIGVDDPSLGLARLDAALKHVTDDLPAVLLAHAPAIYGRAVEEEIDVVLVGHTHGGQVRLPIVGAVYIPGQDLFPEYDRGVFTKEATTMIINAGLGESAVSVRFMCRPEIALITLRQR